jgi:hypothetical protein
MGRRVFSAEVEIDAPPEAVWGVLTDLPSYPAWNPFTLQVRSSLEVGAPVDLRVRMARFFGLTVGQRQTIRAVEPPRRLSWGMRMMGGLIRAERHQTLEPLEGGRTRYRSEDTIEGPLGALVFWLFGPSIDAGFEAMTTALAAETTRRALPAPSSIEA